MKLAALLALALVAAPAGAVVVELHSATVEGKEFRIGDVAVISDVSNESIERLKNLVVGYSPVPGRSRVLSQETIKMRLIQEGFLPRNITVVGEKEPVISRLGQTVTDEEISKAVLEALTPELAHDVSLEIVRIGDRPTLPTGDIVFNIQIPAKMEGLFPVPLEIQIGEEIISTNVTAKTVRMGSVVVTKRRLERGSILAEKDLAVESRDLFTIHGGVIGSIAEVAGMILSRPVALGAVLAPVMVEREKLVKKGDRVRIIIRSSGIELSTAGEANEQGGLGEMIKVRNTESRKIVAGRVTGPGEVTVLE